MEFGAQYFNFGVALVNGVFQFFLPRFKFAPLIVQLTHVVAKADELVEKES